MKKKTKNQSELAKANKKAYYKLYYQSNKDKILKRAKEKPGYAAAAKLRDEKRREENKRKIEESLLAWAKYRLRNKKQDCKKSGLEYSITAEYVASLFPSDGNCPVLGFKLARSGAPSQFNLASIDRIDNSKGYIVGNIAIISCRANTIKRDANIKELELVLAYVRRSLDT